MDNVSLLRDSLDAISGLVTEATFEFSPSGLILKAIDPAVVAMTVLQMLPTCFTQYEVSSPVKITLNLDYFLEVLKRAKQSDKVIIELQSDKGNLKVAMTGNIKRNFVVSLLENPDKEQKVPIPEFVGEVVIDNDVMHEAVKDCQMVSDCATFKASPQSFTITATGDLNNVKHELTKDSPSLKSLTFKEEQVSKYSLEYLEKVIRGDKVAEVTKLQFKTNYLLEVEYRAKDKLSLTFILAPRVDND
ncbi:DNA polymerase sliding clamp 1 [Candidatus Tiddalikarchaeum anstoanum]|nr:DNA polymerase sliding clamp 1 [Candidatus Tiddalikarchaeum anstoanum]